MVMDWEEYNTIIRRNEQNDAGGEQVLKYTIPTLCERRRNNTEEREQDEETEDPMWHPLRK